MSPELRAYLDHTDNKTYPSCDADRDEADRRRALIPAGELAAHARAALEARYALFRSSTAHGKAVQAQIRPAWDNMISKLFMADAAGFELARSQVVEALQAVRLDWPVLPR